MEGLIGYLVGGIVLLLSFVGTFFVAKSKGKKEAEQQQLEGAYKRAKDGEKITSNVSNMSGPELDSELRKSTRDK